MANLVRIFTYKAGLLSRVAHDLRLHVLPSGVSLERSGDQLRGSFDVDAIVVDGAIEDGRLVVDALSERDRSKIADTIRNEILVSRDRAKVSGAPIGFVGTVHERGADALDVRGELELAGARRPLVFTAKRSAGRVSGSIVLRPSDWGIRPYKALAGAIRLQDRVLVELDLDAV